ncbi:hypothetical protein CALVIDRAFT_600565 [Calocera viscosa TUFC12733]|uniref:Decapping nuclease n=1 Tax=Calocera viscosa (strain TUFC12733) TaxID=1330018 RepID=A0A167JHB5_CALVF|nr:hypothetical protein CALVIDRAFT_600565 [Calocera viscosa TUFC12733]
MHSYTSYRGRPYRGAPRSNLSPSNRPTHADLMGGLSDKLAVITKPTIDRIDNTEVKIEDFRSIASYNWLEDAAKPTIVVPGEPPVWSPPAASFQLAPDSKPDYIDQNRAHLDKWPIEPLLQSVKQMVPSFDLSSVDIITSRNNLRKLLRFVLGTVVEDYFRIDAELVGEALVLMRWEAAQVERASQFRGYGANFKERCAKPVRDDSPINHRTVTYNLGGLKFIVGCHVDGQVKAPPVEKKVTADVKTVKATDADDLSALFTGLSVKKTDSVEAFKDSTLRYVKDGVLCPDSATLELHTRSGLRPFEYFEAYAQMHLTKTQWLVVARHNRGYFTMPAEKRSLDDPFFDEHKAKLQDALKRLVAVLKEMKKVVKENGKGAPVAFIFEGSTLDVMPFNRPEKLPAAIIKLFDKPVEA